MPPSFRLFNCLRCFLLTKVCTPCDRGQVYCAAECSHEARREKNREAGKRYQESDRGKLKHAARQVRYRMRSTECRRNVTHQGSAGEGGAIEVEGMSNGSPTTEPERKLQEESPACRSLAGTRTHQDSIGPDGCPSGTDGSVPTVAEAPQSSLMPEEQPCCRSKEQRQAVSSGRDGACERSSGLFRCSFCGHPCGPFGRVGFLGESTLPTSRRAARSRVGGGRRGRRGRATEEGREK